MNRNIYILMEYTRTMHKEAFLSADSKDTIAIALLDKYSGKPVEKLVAAHEGVKMALGRF